MQVVDEGAVREDRHTAVPGRLDNGGHPPRRPTGDEDEHRAGFLDGRQRAAGAVADGAVAADDRAVQVGRHQPRRGHAGVSSARPPRYGRSAAGTCTDPSARWCTSSSTAIVRPTAQSVPFSVAAGAGPRSPRSRMPSRRAWKSVQLLVDVSSNQRDCDGSHASQSNLRAALDPRSPAATSMTRYGSSSFARNSFSHSSSRWCSASSSATSTYENISTLSNWCTRMIPRVSLPWLPASRRKQDEKPA